MKLNLLIKAFERMRSDDVFKENLLDESLAWINKRVFDIAETQKNNASEINVKDVSEFDEGRVTSIARKLSKSESSFKAEIGFMYHYLYEPKTDMKYYDQFPITLVLKKYPKGFLGLNFHYLDLEYRFGFMSQLWDHVIGDEDDLDDHTFFNIRYNTLKGLKGKRYYLPCVKRYLYSQLKSPLYKIPANNWLYAIMLPTSRFFTKNNVKVINRLVHVDSKIRIMGKK